MRDGVALDGVFIDHEAKTGFFRCPTPSILDQDLVVEIFPEFAVTVVAGMFPGSVGGLAGNDIVKTGSC